MPFPSAHTLASLADDLPFLPLDPYERHWLQLSWRGALLMLLALAAYAGTYAGDWLWSDEQLIGSDRRLRTVRGLVAIWHDAFATSGATPPLTSTLWWFEHALFGHDASGFRIVSAAMHGTMCLALWLSMRRLGVSAAWLIAAVIAVHPALVPTLGWPSRQGHVLGGALAAFALLTYLRARRVEPPALLPDGSLSRPEFASDGWPDHRIRSWITFTSIAILTALAWPSAALVLAVVVPTTTFVARGRVDRGGVTIGCVLFVVAGLALCWTGHERAAQGDESSLATLTEVGAAARWIEAIAAVPMGVVHAVTPWAIGPVDDRAAWRARWPMLTGLAAVIVVLLVAMALRQGRRMSIAVVPICAITIAWLARIVLAALAAPSDRVIAANLVDPAAVVSAIALAVGGLYVFFDQRLVLRRRLIARWAAGIALLAILAGLTGSRARIYASPAAMWADAVERNPSASAPRVGFADWYLSIGAPTAAAAQLEVISPERRDACWQLMRGAVFDSLSAAAMSPDARRTLLEQAITHYAVAWRAAPDQALTTITLAEAQRRAGRPGASIVLYESFIARGPVSAAIFTNLGVAHLAVGHTDAAIAAYETALRVDDGFIAARLNLANALFEVGRFEEASAQLKRAVEDDPRNYVAFMNAGSMLARLGALPGAERMFRAAVTIDPESADAADGLGIVLAKQGKLREAIWSFTRAARLRPNDVQIKERLHRATDHSAETAVTRPSAP